MDPNDIEPFNRDAAVGAGYVYTSGARLSSRLATGRSKAIVLGTGAFRGRSVVDLGCGDGHYTTSFWDRGRPSEMVGIDAATSAVAVASAGKGRRPIEFLAGDVHRLPFRDDSFDVALVQSILHHDDNPLGMIREAFRLAPVIVIHEPNGNNPGLKLIERTSRYHIEHRERSYSSYRLRRWVGQAGGVVTYQRYAGLVPMFCPDGLARALKRIEPIVERLPVVNSIGCSVTVLVARRRGRG